MGAIRTWLAAALLVASAAQARADVFTAAQLRTGEAYRRGTDPIAALAPLLTVVRRGRAAGAHEFLAAELALAETYAELGLYADAEVMLAKLAAEPGADPVRVAAARLRMAVRRGAPAPIMRALAAARAAGPLAPDLLFRAAAGLFAARATETPVAGVEAMFAADPQPEAVYLLGVCALLRGDAALAYARFHAAVRGIDRKAHRELFDASALALGRLFYEKADYASAETHYAMVSERSALFDRVLYETAWVYLAQGDVTAAAGNLMRLSVDYPFSPLVPKSQVLYGYLTLRLGRFGQAERVFSAYVAHYSLVGETLAELGAVGSDAALYDRVFADLGGAIASGRNAHVEIESWLAKNGRVRRANELLGKLQRAESELAELGRVLREVQSVAEAGYTQDFSATAAGAADGVAALRAAVDASAARARPFVKGRRRAALRRVEREVGEARLMRESLERMHRRIVEKRREMVSLLQYADAARSTVFDDDGRFLPRAITEPPAANPGRAVDRWAQLDEGERRLLAAMQLVARLEARAVQARLELTSGALPARARAQAAQDFAAWERRSARAAQERRAAGEARLERARFARRQIDVRLGALAALRAELGGLGLAAVAERGRIAREELGAIDRAVGSLLVHARLGSADVAWEMRAYARRRAGAIAASEQADAAALRDFYRGLAQAAAPPADVPAPATGATAQRVSALARRAAAAAAALEGAAGALRRQAEAGRSLDARLHGALTAPAALRTEAAGVLVLAPSGQEPLRALASSVSVDGRLLRSASAEVLVDGYLPPGLHQIDATVHAVTPGGAALRLRGSLVVSLEAARGYRIRLVPAAAPPGLDLRVEAEAAP